MPRQLADILFKSSQVPSSWKLIAVFPALQASKLREDFAGVKLSCGLSTSVAPLLTVPFNLLTCLHDRASDERDSHLDEGGLSEGQEKLT